MQKVLIPLMLVAAIAGCATAPVKTPYVKAPSPSLRPSKMPFKLGIAGFTYHRQSLQQTLAAMQRIDVHELCIKDFHLPLDANQATREAFLAECAAAGVESQAIGPVYFRDEVTARKLFEQAKALGIKTVVVVPYGIKEGEQDGWGAQRFESEESLDILENLVREYDIRAAIHNHGPDIPHLYPTAEAVWARIEKRDARIGFCLDVGHQRRAGLDPVAAIRKYADRIYDVHIKNIKIDPKANFAKEGPRGELDIAGIFTALAEVGYSGCCHLEYEKDFEDNLAEVAESIGYYRGVMDTIRVTPKMMPVPKGANALTDNERADGYVLLFNGRELPTAQWMGANAEWKRQDFPSRGWFVQDGCLTMRPISGIGADGQWFALPPEDQRLGGGGDIITRRKYRDFIFKFDFRLTAAANSGVKYFYDETQNNGTCEEYQILENGHPDSSKGKDGNRKAGSLYDIFPANADTLLKGIGQWNSGMIVAKGSKVEHWLNGQKVLEYDRASEAFKAGVKASKYATWGKTASGESQPWGELAEGRLLLQDHSDSTVSFCNLKVKEL